ncbi:MAG: hypothetical protein L0Y75_11045 [Acidobacteria bacterium]|nr:hypothetical protein [Acidobacteriota bacterium]
MAETVTLEQVATLASQLPLQEQLKLLAQISGWLSARNPLFRESDETLIRHEREARAEAVLALCDAAAARFVGESDAAEDIRQMREERVGNENL